MKHDLFTALVNRGFRNVEVTDIDHARPDGRVSIAATAVLPCSRDLSRAGKLALLRRVMRDMPWRVVTDSSLIYDDCPGDAQVIAYVYVLGEKDGTFRRVDA